MTASLADNLQIWGFESGATIFSDGTLGFGLRLSPVDVSCWEDTRVDALAGKLAVFLNGLPAGVDLQFVQEITSGNADTLGRNAKLGQAATDATVRLLHDTRTKWLSEADAQGLIPSHQLFAFIRKRSVSNLVDKPKLFSKAQAFEKVSEDRLDKELHALSQLKNDIIRGFQSLEMNANVVEERQLADMIYWQWNPGRGVALNQYDPEDLRNSLLFTDVSISQSGFCLGDIRFKVVSLKLLPEQTYASMARALKDLPFNSRLFLSLHVPHQQQELEALQTQRRLAFSMARGKRSGVSDIESEAKLQDLESLISQMVASGEKVFHISLNVLLRSKCETELESQVSQTLMKIRELSGAEGMEESLAAFDIFTELAIPNARAPERAKRVKTSNATDLLPIYGPWAGHEQPRILLRSVEGGLVSFDPFSREFSNYNQIVTGGSGSGKSFLTNLLLLQMLKENPRIFIVDIGGSYKKLCDNLSGQYIQFHLNANFSVNPFDLLPGESTPSSHKIKFLVGMVEMMTREEGDARVGRLERAEIEEAIQTVYQLSPNPRLSDLRTMLLKHKDPAIQRFGKILSPWCGETPFGKIVDRTTTVELERSLVSFDLKGLEIYPDLQAVCLYIITDYVWREVQKDRNSMKFLVFDECWKLLESEAGAGFIGEVFRTFRKYYASAIAISQNIDDFARSRVASAVLPNTSVKWVLMQKGADQARLKEVLQLNENEMQWIASLHQERGSYSQAFLMAEDKHTVVAVEPTPLEYWIATTDPRDLAALEASLKDPAYSSPLDAITKLSETFPRGVAVSKEVK